MVLSQYPCYFIFELGYCHNCTPIPVYHREIWYKLKLCYNHSMIKQYQIVTSVKSLKSHTRINFVKISIFDGFLNYFGSLFAVYVYSNECSKLNKIIAAIHQYMSLSLQRKPYIISHALYYSHRDKYSLS